MNNPTRDTLTQRLAGQDRRGLLSLPRQGVLIACVILLSVGCAAFAGHSYSQTHYYSERYLKHISVGDSRPHILAMFESRRSKGIEGIKIRTTQRNLAGELVEVGEVTLVNRASRRTTPYWFLFKNGLLHRWGRPDEWLSVSAKSGIDFNPSQAGTGRATALTTVAPPSPVRGTYGGREPLHRRALARGKRALAAGKRALTIWKRSPDPEPPAAAQSLAGAPSSFQARNRDARAKPLHKQALAVRQTPSADPPAAAQSLARAPSSLQAKNGDARAEPLHKQALAVRQTPSADPPAAARSLARAPSSLPAQNGDARAEPLPTQALATRQLDLGSDYPAAAQSLTRLASSSQLEGNYARAELFLNWAIEIREKALGAQHPDVAISLTNLAALYFGQGRYLQAEPLLKRALAIREKALGPAHPDVAMSLENYADLLHRTHRTVQATRMQARAAAIRTASR